VQIHPHDVSESVPQCTKNKTEGKGLLSFVKNRILQDPCGSHTSDEQSLWLSWGGGTPDLTTLSDLPKAIYQSSKTPGCTTALITRLHCFQALPFSRKLCLPPSREENKTWDLPQPTQKLKRKFITM